MQAVEGRALEKSADRSFFALFSGQIRIGLSAKPGEKFLPSEMFYYGGSDFFERITRLPVYYPTALELEIFKRESWKIGLLMSNCGIQRIAELGSGNGSKTVEMFRDFRRDFCYCPIDVSGASLRACCEAVEETFGSEIKVQPFHGDNEVGLKEFYDQPHQPGHSALIWAGSSAGNLTKYEMDKFLQKLHRRMDIGDLFIIGIDCTQDDKLLQLAYDDPTGVTRAMNLHVIELFNAAGADFVISNFRHVACRDENGMVSYLESLCAQRVAIPELGMIIDFEAGERIKMEVSTKYRPEELRALFANNGFQAVDQHELHDYHVMIFERH